MQIGFLGTGRMSARLGTLWSAQGHQVMFGSRDPGKARALADVTSPDALSGSYADAAAFGAVIVLGVPWSAAEPTVKAAGSLVGKVLIDLTNPPGPGGLSVGRTTSAAETIAGWAPGARVVKAFNTIHFRNLDQPTFNGQPAPVFVCGDDAPAKAIVMQLGAAIGFEPVDCGLLTAARLLEPLGALWIQLAFAQGMGTEFAIGLLRR